MTDSPKYTPAVLGDKVKILARRSRMGGIVGSTEAFIESVMDTKADTQYYPNGVQYTINGNWFDRADFELLDKPNVEADATEVIAEATKKIELLTHRVAAAEALATARGMQLESFKEQVREVAIRVADEQGWCNDGLNETLEELGLPRKVTTFEVIVKVPAYQFVTLTVEADDEGHARDLVESNDVDPWETCQDTESWEYDSYNGISIDEVNPVE